MSRPLLVASVEGDDALQSVEREWRALEPELAPLPFVRFDWIDAWWTHLRADRVAVRDRLSLRVCRTPHGDLVGIAPLMLSVRPGVGPPCSRQLHLIGADANITEIRGLVTVPEQEAAVVEALLDHLDDCSDSWDWFLFSGLTNRAAPYVLKRVPLAHTRHEFPNYELTLPSSWDTLKRQISRNARESLRKCYNSLKRENIRIEVNIVSSRDEAAAAIAHFLRLHSARAQLTGTVPHPDVFKAEETRRFLVDVCQRFADRDALRIFQIAVGGTVVATRIAFVVGDSLYLYYSGYDPAYSRFSIMTTVVAEAIQYAIREKYRTVNLSTGRDVSKERWRPREITYRDAEIVSPSLRGRFAHRMYALAKTGLPAMLQGLARSADPRVGASGRSFLGSAGKLADDQ